MKIKCLKETLIYYTFSYFLIYYRVGIKKNIGSSKKQIIMSYVACKVQLQYQCDHK